MRFSKLGLGRMRLLKPLPSAGIDVQPCFACLDGVIVVDKTQKEVTVACNKCKQAYRVTNYGRCIEKVHADHGLRSLCPKAA